MAIDIGRREFISVLGGAAASSPLAVRAQQAAGRVRRVGILMASAEIDPEGRKYVAAFVGGLRELGWNEGGNVRFEYRWGSADVSRIHSAAAELVALGPDVILAQSSFAVVPLRAMSGTIPIVFLQIVDPVGSGLVASLAKPGGNLTGFTPSEFSMSGKMLEVLKDVAPLVTRVGVIYHAAQAPQVGMWRAIEAAAPSLGMQVSAANAEDADQIAHVIENFPAEPGGGMIVLPSPITLDNHGLIIALMARYRLPAVYPFPNFVRDGGLVSYGVDPIVQYREAASYVDRILKGTKPADLPVQQPTKFDLAVNLKTAKTLGLTLPESFLQRADEVIE